MDEMRAFVQKILRDLKTMLSEVQLSQKTNDDLWTRLLCINKYDLIQLLRNVEKQTPGFTTIIVPSSGFVPDPVLNDLILKWLRHKRVNVLDVKNNIREMQLCLK
jgi:hypothetical protein